MANQLIVPYYNGNVTRAASGDTEWFRGWRAFKLEDDDVVVPLVDFNATNINNSTKTIEKRDGEADYQTPASGTIPYAIINIETAAVGSSRVISMLTNSSADTSDGGDTELDKATNIDADNVIQTLIGTGLANSEYLSIKNSHASNIRIRNGWVVERP